MSESLVPPAVRLAAKRGFIRTAAQSLSAAIPSAGIALALSGDWWLAAGLGAGSAVVTALLAGTASYLSIISKGVPGEYIAAGTVED